MKAFKLTLVGILLTSISFGQNYNWFESFGGTDDDRANCMVIDQNGDLIVVGNFAGTTDFDPSSGTMEATSNGAWDVFVAKYDTTGNLIWAKTLGGTGYDYGQVLHVEGTDIYVGGIYDSTIDIDPGIGEVLISATGISSFLVKLNSNGDYQWSRNLTGYDVRVSGIDVGPQGIVCAGTFHQTAEFNNEGTTVQMTSLGATDIYVMTLTSAGIFSSIEQIGSPDQNLVRGFEIDASGNIYLASEYQGSIDIDPGAGTTTLSVSNPSNYGSFIAKYNSAMELQWGKNFNFPNYSNVQYLEISPNDEIVFSGYFQDSILFDEFGDNTWYLSEGAYDVFIGKMDLDGNGSWFKRFGNIENDESARLHVGQSGSIYLHNQFRGTVDMDPGNSVVNATAVGNNDNYIMCLDENGDLLWFLQDSIDNQNYSFMPAIVEGVHNDLYGVMNFNTELGLLQNGTTYSFTSAGDYDLLLMQLRTDSYLSVQNNDELSIKVYPNPAQDIINVEGLLAANIEFRIVDLSGKLLISGKTNGIISIESLQPGIYLLQFGNNSVRFIKK